MKTEFLEYMMEHLMLKTQENYKRALRHLEKEGIILDDPSSFKEWILEEKGKGTLDRTINVYIKAYNFYLKYLGYTPVRALKENENPRRPRADIEDYQKLLGACNGYTAHRDRLMVEILFKAGLRYTELISLSVDDLDLSNDKIIVKAGKGQKYREVYMFPSVKEAASIYLSYRKSVPLENRNTLRLWINQYGKPISKEGGRNAIYRIAGKAGITFSPHRARRFYARHLWEQGIRPEIIQHLMGHSDLATTLLYTQIDQKDVFREMRNSMKKLDFKEKKGREVHNPEHMLRPGRDLNPSHRLDRPV